MLGEEKIEGKWNIKVSDRTICFPKELKTEDGETLVIIRNGEDFEIISYEVFKDKVIKWEQLVAEQKQSGNNMYYKLKEELYDYYRNVEVPAIVHSNKIIIPETVNERINIDGEYFLEGHNKFVKLRKK